MANDDHVAMLKQGVAAWNAWCDKNPDICPNLREAHLREADLREADLSEANLSGADLRWADLREADLSGANLRGANLRRADLREADLISADLNAGAQVLEPDDRVVMDDLESPLNKDFYANLKAQAWWQLRLRFERTHRAVVNNVRYDPDELISLPSTLPQLRTLQKELSQPTMSKGTRMKLVIDKQPEGTMSPNMADAVVMAYWPVDANSYDLSMSWV